MMLRSDPTFLLLKRHYVPKFEIRSIWYECDGIFCGRVDVFMVRVGWSGRRRSLATELSKASYSVIVVRQENIPAFLKLHIGRIKMFKTQLK
jgi:hypothetical protein